METPLALCLLAIFIARGVSLECQSCSEDKMDCTGPTNKTCPSASDTCGIIQVVKLPNPIKEGIVKKCFPLKDCNKGIAIIDMGKNGIIVRNVSCCSGDDCQKKAPSWPLPTRNTTQSNNKKCPTCYSVESQCKNETIRCTGDGEVFCAEVSHHMTDAGGKNISTIMKGCANKAFCDSMQSLFPEGMTKVSSKCTSPNGAARLRPGLFGFFLFAQAGLLFVTVLL